MWNLNCLEACQNSLPKPSNQAAKIKSLILTVNHNSKRLKWLALKCELTYSSQSCHVLTEITCLL